MYIKWPNRVIFTLILHKDGRWAHCSDSRGHGEPQGCRMKPTDKRGTLRCITVRGQVLIFLGWESGAFYAN